MPELTQEQKQALQQRQQEQMHDNVYRTTAIFFESKYVDMNYLTDEPDHPYLVSAMQQLAGAPFPVQEALREHRETRSERKKRESMEKQQRKAHLAASNVDGMEMNSLTRHSRDALRNAARDGQEFSEKALKLERQILDQRLAAINELEKADLLAVEVAAQQLQRLAKAGGDVDNSPENSPEAQKLKAQWDAQQKRADAYHVMSTQLPLHSKERASMMAKREEAVLKAGLLRQQWKVACMPEGKEKTREAATIKRHAKFDALKKIFRKPSPYSHEDAVVTITEAQQQKHLINAGRATLGGTKAMYIFEERLEYGRYQQWLFKEATNCIGMSKPEGAVVTGEASKLQQLLRGDLSIPAQCLKDENGKVVGSIQKRVQKAEGGVDLFKWQAQSDLRENMPSKTTLDDLMHEHTLDWILCNFDTKGENFINQERGHIISFDKEASFNTLLKEGSREMSYTFKPHSNDTIYNTMFAAFARGEIPLDLDANMESIQKLEQIPADEFIGMFKETLDTKYGAQGPDRQEAERVLRERHRDLRSTYRKFYSALLKERLQVTRHPKEREKLHSMMKEGTFVFADERQQ